MPAAPEARPTAETDPTPPRTFSLGPRAAAVFLATMVGTAVRFGVQLLLVRWLGTAGFGRFATARGWGELLAKLPDRGYVLGSVRFIPRYFAAGDYGRHNGVLRRAIVGTLRTSVLLVAVAMLVGLALNQSTASLMGFSLAITIAMAGLLRAALQGSHHYMPATLIMELGQPLSMATGFAALWYFDRLTILTALAVVFGTWALVAALQWALLDRVTPEEVHSAEPVFEDEEWTRSTRQLFLAQLGIGVINISDLLIVGAFVGATEAGIYAIATRIAAIGRIANAAVESLVSPQIAAAANDGPSGYGTIQRTIDRAIGISVIPSFGFVLFAIVFAVPILDFVGKDFAGGRAVLIVLVFGNLADAVSGPSGHVVSLVGSERSYAHVMLANAVALLALAVPAGMLYGMVGVAVVRTVINVSWNAALFGIARSKFGLWCLPSRRILAGLPGRN